MMTKTTITLRKIVMKNSRVLVFLILTSCLLSSSAIFARPMSDQTDVRAAVQRIFDQIKNGQYEALYDAMPASARTRVSRERLVQGLQKTRNLYELQRIQIGPVSVSGNLAVVDTTMYAH